MIKEDYNHKYAYLCDNLNIEVEKKWSAHEIFSS